MGAAGTQTVDTTAHLTALRQHMNSPNCLVQAIVVPSEDQREQVQ